MDKSKEFYIKILNFRLEYERKDDKLASLSYRRLQVIIEDINNHWSVGKLSYPFSREINFQITTNKIGQNSDRLKQNQIPIYKGLFKSKYTVDKFICREGTIGTRSIWVFVKISIIIKYK